MNPQFSSVLLRRGAGPASLVLTLLIAQSALAQEATPAAPPATQTDPPAAGDVADAEVTVDAEASAESVPSAAPAATKPAPTAVNPAPEMPAVPTPSSASALATGTPDAPKDSVVAEGASILASSGYPLTPGVSSLPLKPGFVFSGYLQAQYEAHQDSVDQLQQGGSLLNQNRFLIRRGRFRITQDSEWTELLLELDGSTTRGPSMRLQKAEASVIYRRSADRDQPPMLQLTLGQFDQPFGFEVPYSSKQRWFMERTQGSRALWPSEPDLGAKLSGGLGFSRYSLAVTNGEPLDVKTGFPLQDPNINKDVTARFGAEAKASPKLVVVGGVSMNRGKGLSPGVSATKNSVQWSDANGNSNVDPGANELVGQPAEAASLSKNFERWAVGADAEILYRTSLGWSMLYAEAIGASNLDRGLYLADPVQTGTDVREFSYYVAFTQEVTEHGVLGVRFDSYDPNADLIDQRRGKIVPVAQDIQTLSLLGGLVLPGSGRILLQYDIIRDRLARNALGVPADLENNQWTLRFQVNP